MSDEPLPIFVYGTLQRGEVRAPRWPVPPTRVEWATIRGRVHDLGPYPALVEGPDLILGEVWFLPASGLDETLRVLDEIECYGHEEVDLYVRRTVACQLLCGGEQRAYAYFFADPTALERTPIVPPNEQGLCHWRRQSDRFSS